MGVSLPRNTPTQPQQQPQPPNLRTAANSDKDDDPSALVPIPIATLGSTSIAERREGGLRTNVEVVRRNSFDFFSLSSLNGSIDSLLYYFLLRGGGDGGLEASSRSKSFGKTRREARARFPGFGTEGERTRSNVAFFGFEFSLVPNQNPADRDSSFEFRFEFKRSNSC